MKPDEPTLTEIKNGWHYGSRALNLTVRGDTPEDARRLFATAVRKATEMLARPGPAAPA
jgi:hypothetical protein